MSIELNHTIFHALDPHASATFLAEMLGRLAPVRFGPFWDVELYNRVTLTFIRADKDLTIEHYAFFVSEDEFDRLHWQRHSRVRQRARTSGTIAKSTNALDQSVSRRSLNF